jgi:hypothetical protein
LNILKLTFIKQRMLAVLITLTPTRQNKFIDSQNAKVRVLVQPSKDAMTFWNMTLEWLERDFQFQEFTCQWLRIPIYSDYHPLFTIQAEWSDVKYVVEVLGPIQYCTELMSEKYTVTLHHGVTVYNDMFDQRRVPVL